MEEDAVAKVWEAPRPSSDEDHRPPATGSDSTTLVQ